MSYRDIVRAQLRIDEGVKDRIYRDTRGILTLGVGHNVEAKPLPAKVIDLLLECDIDDAERDARSLVLTFDELSPARQAVLVNLAFNLGRTRLAGFRHFLTAVAAGDWETAAREMLDSDWAHEVHDRADRLAGHMRSGQ
jgi:lysozyme